MLDTYWNDDEVIRFCGEPFGIFFGFLLLLLKAKLKKPFLGLLNILVNICIWISLRKFKMDDEDIINNWKGTLEGIKFEKKNIDA